MQQTQANSLQEQVTSLDQRAEVRDKHAAANCLRGASRRLLEKSYC